MITHETRGSVATGNGDSQPLTVTWSWAPDQPFTIAVGFTPDDTPETVTTWRIPRDFLAAALEREDTHTRLMDGPSTIAVASLRVGPVLFLKLYGELNGEPAARQVVTQVPPLEVFLGETFARVPAGCEPVDVDGLIAACLGDAA